MAWIDVVEPEEADGELASIYEEVSERRGTIANVYRIQSRNPPALRAHLDLYMSLLYRKGGLSRAQREMIGVVVSGLNRCAYCVVHHSEALGRYEKDPRVHAHLSLAFREAPLSAADRAMLAYCEKLTRRPGSMTKGDVDALRDAGFGDEEILDINQIASYFNFVNRTVSGLGVELEEAAERTYRY